MCLDAHLPLGVACLSQLMSAVATAIQNLFGTLQTQDVAAVPHVVQDAVFELEQQLSSQQSRSLARMAAELGLR